MRAPLIRTHRKLARVILYGVLALAAVALWAGIRLANEVRGRFAAALDRSWATVDWSEYESVRLFQDYLRIDTSADGNEIPGVELLARILSEAGIEAHVEILGERNANLWAILEGDDPRGLVLHGHVDVDRIYYPDRWPHPPFSGFVEPPYIYGRGAFDMKSITIAQLMSLLELKRAGVPLRRSLVFLVTGDEESGSSVLGTRWILARHPDLVERFGVVLTEGGAVEAIAVDRVKYWGTETLQKRFIDIEVCDSRPDRLELLRRDLSDPARQGRLRVNEEATGEFFRLYAGTRERPAYRRALLRPRTLADDLTFEKLALNIRSMLRNEVVAFPIERSPEGGYSMWVILHLLPWLSFEEGWDELLGDGVLSTFAYSCDVPHGPLAPSSVEHPVFRTIDAHVRAAHPETVHGPLFVPWSATDSRFFRTHGIPSYGFSPFVIVTTDTTRTKGPGERMALPAFVDGVDLYVGVVRDLVTRGWSDPG